MLADWVLLRSAQHVSQNQSHNNRIIKPPDRSALPNRELDRRARIYCLLAPSGRLAGLEEYHAIGNEPGPRSSVLFPTQ
jgi:hypothetical protein